MTIIRWFVLITGMFLSLPTDYCAPAIAAPPFKSKQAAILDSVLLYASFDDAVRGDRGIGRLLLETRSGPPGNPTAHQFQQGYSSSVYRVKKAAGIVGGALACLDVLPNNGRLYFPGDGHLAFHRGGWGGAVQFWLNTNPDKLLKTSFCDPIQITAKSAHDGGLWIDFPDDSPRSIRMGMFSGLAVEEKPIPESDPQAPIIRVPQIGFQQGEWHHVVLTWNNFDTGRVDARAILYVDGKPVGERTGIKVSLDWDMARVGIYLAVNYIGMLDEFATFDRMLTAEEVALLHRKPDMLQQNLLRRLPEKSPEFLSLRRQAGLEEDSQPGSPLVSIPLSNQIIARLATLEGRRELPALLAILRKLAPRNEAVATPSFPFNSEAAAKYQTEYAESVGLPLEVTNHLGMTFRLIPPGMFLMGSPEAELGHGSEGFDETQHKVTLHNPFYLATTETTVEQFREFVDSIGYVTDVEQAGGGNAHDERADWKHRPGTKWTEPGFAGPFDLHDVHPAVHVSLTDARRFCRWLAEASGGDDPAEGFYDLPTEAQWEWAARAGSAERFWWGDELDSTRKRANMGDEALLAVHPKWPRKTLPLNDGYAFLAPVKSYQPNPFGLYDMLGNVWEFCATRYAVYPQEPVANPAPVNPTRGYAVRGGGWSNIPDHCRAASRNADPPHFGHSNLGFRIAIQLP